MQTARKMIAMGPRLIILWLSCLLLVAPAARSDSNNTAIYSFAEFPRLRGVVVRDVYQDSLSFIWLATDDGVWRWNAGGFERLEFSPPLTPPALCLLEDPDRRTMWAGTTTGLVAFDMLSLKLLKGMPLLPDMRIRRLCRDRKGRIWIGAERGLYQLNLTEDSPSTSLVPGTKDVDVLAITVNPAGDILVGTRGAVLRVGEEGVTKEYGDLVGDGHVRGLLLDRSGALWMGIRNPGRLYRIHDNDIRQFDHADGLRNTEVNAIIEHPDGGVWVGTEHGVYELVDGVCRTALTRGSGLASTDVHSLRADFEGQLWIGTYGAGVYHLRSPHVRSYGATRILGHPFITSLAKEADDRFVVGTIQGARLFEPHAGAWSVVGSAENITATFVDADGEVWLGTKDKVVRTSDNKTLAAGEVMCLDEDESGFLLVGTRRGLMRWQDDRLVPVPLTPRGSGAVRDIYRGRDGSIYLGTDKGLVRLVGHSAELLLSGRNILAVSQDESGVFWLGTRRGVVTWDGESEKKIFGASGPLNAEIRAIIHVENGDAWAASDVGLIRIRDHRAERFGLEMGLPSRDVRCLAPGDAQTLYAGTTQGLAQIDLDRIHPCLTPPRCIAGPLKAGGQTYFPDQGVIELPYQHRDVMIPVESLGWRSAVGLRYRYRLVGFEDHWSSPSMQRSPQFSSLAPGPYEFQAQAINERGLESEVASLRFRVARPFWKQLWFLAIVSTFSLTTLALAIRSYRLHLQLRRKAEEALRIKSDFTSRMSHEIRTPLTAILACSEMLADVKVSAEQRKENIESIIRNGRHLLAVANDVLDLSKLNEARMETDPGPFDLHALLEEVRSFSALKAADMPIKVELEVMPHVPRGVITDATKLRQVLFNLMDNAVRFTSQGAVQLTASVPQKGQHDPLLLTITVADTGIGIPADKTAVVFDVFKQADSSIHRLYGGTGLGLTIAKSLAELLSGSLTMESEEGVGTTFTLSIPVEVADIESIDQPANPAPPLGIGSGLESVNVLIADDCPDTRRILQVIIERFGARVYCVASGAEALTTATQRSFDIILLDIHMPDLDGIATLQQLHQQAVDTPAIAITADATATTARRCLEAGFDELIMKPLDRVDLLLAMRRLVDPKPTDNRPSNLCAIHRLSCGEPPGIAPAEDGLTPIASTLASFSAELAKASATFAHALAGDIEKLERALADSDLGTLREISHRLKGAGGINGYLCVSRSSAVLEKAIAAGNLSIAADSIDQLKRFQQRMVDGIETDLSRTS